MVKAKVSGSLKQYNLVFIHDVLSNEFFVIDFRTSPPSLDGSFVHVAGSLVRERTMSSLLLRG